MSVRESSIDRAIDQHTDAVFATVGEPVRYASLFYTLYYLVEIEGVTEAAFDFKQVRDQSARGFYWYGIGSISTEASHLDDRYFIDGAAPKTWRSEGNDERVSEYVRHELFPDDAEMAEQALRLIDLAPHLWDIEAVSNFERVLLRLENHLSAVTDPEGYIELVFEVFKATEFANAERGAGDPKTIQREGLTGWPHGYNGPAWEGICEHLLRRDSLSDTAFVDTSWSIEHNNRRWIDKIGLFVDDTQNEAVIEMLDVAPDRGSKVGPNQMTAAVEDVLDAARDGPTSRLFEWAEFFDADVGINLRRWRQRLNI